MTIKPKDKTFVELEDERRRLECENKRLWLEIKKTLLEMQFESIMRKVRKPN